MEAATKQVLQLLGLAKRAGLVGFGHDAVKFALRERRAKLCLLAKDASPRLVEEFKGLTAEAKVPLLFTDAAMADYKQATQVPAAVLSVNENGFATKISTLLKEI